MTEDLLRVLKEIAQGRTDCGLPLAREIARQRARAVLNKHGVGWSEIKRESNNE